MVLAVREDGEDTLLFYRILSSRDGEDWAADGEKILAGQIARGYEKESGRTQSLVEFLLEKEQGRASGTSG